jgi:murein DD-endopeptidase MepM/ murein hydrolase activator NlpD
LALDRSPRGAEPALALGGYVPPVRRGHHRVSAPNAQSRGHAAIAAVATGATIAAGYSVGDLAPTEGLAHIAMADSSALVQSTDSDHRSSRLKSTTPAGTRYTRQTPELSAMDDDSDVADVASLTKAVKVGERLARRAAGLSGTLADGVGQVALFGGQEFVMPTSGVFTSGFGGRWGTVHQGIDLAARIGTPIYAVTDGTVISSGPASGFGMWVRVLHPGGWISIYGHINRSFVRVGQQVRAGQQIAEVGNRGQTTGPHLHFEVHNPAGQAVNPVPWLALRGIHLSGGGTGAGRD